MKKLLITLTIIIAAVLYAPSAQAAWSNWQTEGFGHQARVFTDDTNYYAGASTVDWRAEKRDRARYITPLAFTKSEAVAA